MLMDWQDEYVKVGVLPKPTHRLNVIPMKIPTQFFTEIE